MNAGVTRHCRVSFDSLAVKSVATKLVSMCDEDYELLSRWFGGIELPGQAGRRSRLRLRAQLPERAKGWRGHISRPLSPSRPGPLPVRLRPQQALHAGAGPRGWIDSDGGGQGHSVARFLAAHALGELSQAEPEPALRPEASWLHSARPDYLSRAGDDEAADGSRVTSDSRSRQFSAPPHTGLPTSTGR